MLELNALRKCELTSEEICRLFGPVDDLVEICKTIIYEAKQAFQTWDNTASTISNIILKQVRAGATLTDIGPKYGDLQKVCRSNKKCIKAPV